MEKHCGKNRIRALSNGLNIQADFIGSAELKSIDYKPRGQHLTLTFRQGEKDVTLEGFVREEKEEDLGIFVDWKRNVIIDYDGFDEFVLVTDLFSPFPFEDLVGMAWREKKEEALILANREWKKHVFHTLEDLPEKFQRFLYTSTIEDIYETEDMRIGEKWVVKFLSNSKEYTMAFYVWSDEVEMRGSDFKSTFGLSDDDSKKCYSVLTGFNFDEYLI